MQNFVKFKAQTNESAMIHLKCFKTSIVIDKYQNKRKYPKEP